MVQAIQRFRAKLNQTNSTQSMIAIELNTSCPNIPNSPPSAYKFLSLVPLLRILKDEFNKDETLTIGLKLPPFVYRDQFREVLDGIKALCASTDNGVPTKCPFAFFTCTNTLGTNLLFAEQADLPGQQSGQFAVPPALGGLAGDTLHTLSLGNVYTFAQLLKEPEYADLKDITIIGVGGVTSKEAAGRMRRAGAAVVGCATLFGKEGVKAFEIIMQ
jgi:dihydroorotate dehydrogenase (fumarate)